jgi:TetR/AcrR family transcriptional regulator, tetracycline repressor protein
MRRNAVAFDPDTIARRALDLMAKVGLDGLTTRSLAEQLGVQGPALYHHFSNKSELLGYMASAMLRESLVKCVARGDWRRWLLDHAVATRTTLLRYRDSARVLAASAPTQAMKQEIMPAIAKPLLEAGFRRVDAAETVSLFAAFTLGYVINEQNEVMRGYMSSVIHVDRGFRHGVEALIAGVELKYGGRLKAAAPARKRSAVRRADRPPSVPSPRTRSPSR